MEIISPCISVCVTDPVSGYCYGCARTDQEKKLWKDPNTKDAWKEDQLSVLKGRMSGFQLEAFRASYNHKKNSGTSLIKEAKLISERK
jgi:predicted Fe-S protein YdhL (DUF1289 family)